jgi:hypothetical protein
MTSSDFDSHQTHHATDTEASNGEGTVDTPTEGETLDHPVLDGSTEYYGNEEGESDPRSGMSDPALIRHPETGEKSPTPEDYS